MSDAAEQNLGDLLSRRAERSPDREALVDVESGLRLSWSELDERVNRSAQALRALGVERGDRVALLLRNGPAIFECFLASARLGAIAVPLNWRLVAREIDGILRDADARCLVFSGEFDAVVEELHGRAAAPAASGAAAEGEAAPEGKEEREGESTAGALPSVWLRVAADSAGPSFAHDYARAKAAAPAEPPRSGAGGEDDLILLYTSGTTGLPKGALHSHRSALWGARAWVADLDLRRGDRWLLFMPAFHVGGLNPFVVCIERGATCVVMPAFDPERVWETIARERITNTLAVPAMLDAMLPPVREGRVDASGLRWILTGASPIPEALLEEYVAREIEVVSAYGLSEAYGIGCVLDPADARERTGSVGRGFFHVDVRLVDASGADVASGIPGELLLRGPCVMKGYWRRPEESAATLRDGWLHTGDIAVRDEQGFVSIRDRIKDMIISGGENIYPAEIENVLHAHPGVADVAVIGQPSAHWGESPLAVVVRSDAGLAERDVVDWCKGRLARFKWPKSVSFVEALPRNAAGKLLKRELRERFSGPAASDAGDVDPRLRHWREDRRSVSKGFDVAVVGAGVIGMACAAELARAGRQVVVLERHAHTALETSSHNSEVIHAGLHYPPGSLKAETCIEGRDLLYARCTEKRIPHRRIGKLIVAVTKSEVTALEEIARQAERAGAAQLEWFDASKLQAREPGVTGEAALFSPLTGVVDAHALVDSYQAELEAAGGRVVLRTEVTGLQSCAAGWRVETRDDAGETATLEVGRVVNAAGLASDRIAALAGLDVDELGWRLHPCKGDYFGLEPERGQLTRHLVYPVPGTAGLGIHVTVDLGGRTRFGPDAEYLSAGEPLSYAVDPGKAARFARSVQRYLPELREVWIFPEMAGIRPKLQGPGDPFRDFVVAESSAHGAPGMVHLVGIESPGLTASEALARRAARLLA